MADTVQANLTYKAVVKQIIDTDMGVYNFFNEFIEEYGKFHNYDSIQFTKSLQTLIEEYRSKGLF